MNQAAALYQHLKDRAEALDAAAFVLRHGGWYLFSQQPTSQADRIPFVTQVHDPNPIRPPKAEPSPEPSAPPDRLWKVEKSAEHAWKRRISLGRAPNNDVVIRHDSVSKLHAHFHQASQTLGSPADAPGMLITDVGSSNGTTVNGSLLTVDVSTLLKNQDRIMFGSVATRFLDASALHAELNALDWF